MESEQVYLGAAETLCSIMEGRDWFFKASFDKANRTSIAGARGPGLDEGLRLLAKARESFPGIKLTTDVHEPWQVPLVAPLVDMIQVPAFLCRQTDLLVECARHCPIVNVKKGQWLSPHNIMKTVDKIKATPGVQAWLTERGTPLGYDHLIVDPTIVDLIKASAWDSFILDCTHSVQRSRQVHGVQGDRVLAKRYFLAAPVLGYDGVFAETHPDPDSAISDGDCQIPLSEMAELIARQDAVREAIR
jgi:2-dehydro-3-deoxyphosphooctonate aldolase (KDO 8-P synthase)